VLTTDELPACPVATTLRLIGNKWKIFVIQRLMERPYGFNELQRSIEGISEKVLSQNLHALEADGILTRTVIPGTPIRTEYALSETGESMRPIIESMAAWGEDYQRRVRSA
jgi:DNA-binding HxlR family transcriptional regulator